MERDEDIFPLLNEWADTGCLPPGLLPSSSSASHTQHSQHSTPSVHGRRLSMQQPQLSSSQTLPASSNSTTGASTASLATTLTSPLSTQSLNDMLSPAGSSIDFTSGGSGAVTALHIYTVTVGERPSKARYSLPDLSAFNALIAQLAHQQLQPSQSPGASPPSRTAALSGSYELKGISDITLPSQQSGGFDSEKEMDAGRGAMKAGHESVAH